MWTYNTTPEAELYHHGIKGMKWGARRTKEQLGYRSTGLKSAMARRSNEKIDKSFKAWEENTKKRDNAIDLGKKATAAKLAYEKDRGNKDLKTAYKDANKQYKKALSENTTYRKGTVRSEVGKDASRKYLSEAKKVKKQLESDPSNKDLQKKYNDLMSKHDVERAKARRAQEVGANRSAKIAALKRQRTNAVKAVVGTAVVAAGAAAVNRYLNTHETTINGKRVKVSTQTLTNIAELAKKGKQALGYIY